ncbi:MAG: peptidoglycan-associated lipoprotein Pal [Desulfatirhabdiaceae bacterium]
MKKRIWVVVAMLFVLPGLLLTASCAKKAVKPDASVAKTDDDAAKRAAAEKARLEEEARQRALEEARLKEEAAKREALAARNKFMNENVHFAFDSSVLDTTAQSILKSKADWMKKNPNAPVIIEGHCDERGTVAYNLALGERRAESAKAFLVNMGISAGSMSTISYGEERPVDPGKNEDAWAKNRRAHFVIK